MSEQLTITAPASIKREEYTYKGRRVILDAARLGDKIEVMLMSNGGGTEYACETVDTEAEALEAFDRIRAAHIPDNERPQPSAPAPLSGKYAKLRDDLKAVHKIGLSAADKVEDGGTCNHDAPALHLPLWKRALVEQACEEAGGGCFFWRCFGANMCVVCLPTPGQAYKQETAAEAMTKALSDLGYDALCYQAMD